MGACASGFFGMSDQVWLKVAQAVIRLVAFGLIVISVLLCSGELYVLYQHATGRIGEGTAPALATPIQWGWVAVKCIPILVALVLLIFGRPLAERFTRDLD
jgi:Na+/proline symporter